MSININIEEIIKTFASKKIIFQQEAQLQFSLAWELQKQIERNNIDAKVYLEFLGCQDNKNNRRFYSDIIIIDKEQNYIVIELKYKTKQAEYTNGHNEKVKLFGHGAPDEGRYDYLLDIRRIELFKNRDNENYLYSKQLKTFEKGYAILITNENQYWMKTKKMAHDKKTVDAKFCIGENDTINGEISWTTEEIKNWMKSRESFDIKGEYKCKWQDYCEEERPRRARNEKKFRYLITEINQQSTED